MVQHANRKKAHATNAEGSRIHSYVVEHDQGFAPNPYWGWCSLANCKPDIRLGASIGDRIIGTGSTVDDLRGHLVYWMRVDEIMTFDEYWVDPRFRCKRPILNGSKVQYFGDNIYRTKSDGSIDQLDSFHSEPNGVLSEGNLKTDTGKTNRVLVSKKFSYFGDRAPRIPDHLQHFVKKGPGRKNKFSDEQQESMDEWLQSLELGCRGRPAKWRSREIQALVR